MQEYIALQAYFEFVRPTASSFSGVVWRKGAHLAVLVLGYIAAVHTAMSLSLHIYMLVVTVKCMLDLPGQLESPNWTWGVCEFISRLLRKLWACLEYCRDSFSPPAVDVSDDAEATNLARSRSSEGSRFDSIGTAAIQGSVRSLNQADFVSSRAAAKQASSAEGRPAPTAAQPCTTGSLAQVGGSARAGQCLAAAHQLAGVRVSAPEAFSPPASCAIQVIFGTVNTWPGNDVQLHLHELLAAELVRFRQLRDHPLNCACSRISQ